MQAGFAPVKVASCFAAILALGVTSVCARGRRARGGLLVAEYGRGVIYRISDE
jgi:hypothetical protein